MRFIRLQEPDTLRLSNHAQRQSSVTGGGLEKIFWGRTNKFFPQIQE